MLQTNKEMSLNIKRVDAQGTSHPLTPPKKVMDVSKRAQLKHHIQKETTQQMHSSYNVKVTTARRERERNIMI